VVRGRAPDGSRNRLNACWVASWLHRIRDTLGGKSGRFGLDRAGWLDVEVDAAVRMILVICVAQHHRELDRVPEALAWTRALRFDPTLPVELRLGGAIAWLNLTSAALPPGLRRLRDEVPVPVVRELAQHLPWIWWLSYYPPDGIETWWQRLDQASSD